LLETEAGNARGTPFEVLDDFYIMDINILYPDLNTMETQNIRVTQGGRIVLPAAVRRTLNIRAGDQLGIQVIDGEVRLQPRHKAIRRIQALVRAHIPTGESLVEELLAERRIAATDEAKI